MKRQKGFTLIELLIVMAIIAITLTLAIPSFQRSISDNKVSNTANDLLIALQEARSHALKEQKLFGVSLEPDGAWYVYREVSGVEANKIFKHEATKGITITPLTDHPYVDTPRYASNGDGIVKMVYEYEIRGTNPDYVRIVKISLGGKPSVEKPI